MTYFHITRELHLKKTILKVARYNTEKMNPKEHRKQKNRICCWLGLIEFFMTNSSWFKLPSTPPSTGISRNQHLTMIRDNLEIKRVFANGGKL